MSKPIQINGFCDSRFMPIQEAFIKNFENELEVGASVALMADGEPVVDLWAGYSDRKKTKPWVEDTIVNVYSTTKNKTTLCSRLMAEKGKLDGNAPVAKYWPEFAQQGKENVLVRHVLGHSAGLPAWDDVHPYEAMFNWDKVVGLLEKQKPWWEPGDKSGYHIQTFGFLLGEVVRRISGQTIGNFFRQEIAEEIGADFHIGLAEEHAHRVAQLTFSAPREVEDHDSIAFRVMNNIEPGWDRESRAAQAAEMPASSGFGNARSMALTGAIIANGGELSGKRFLSRQTVEMIFEEQSYREDLVFGVPVRFGLGMGLNSQEFPFPNTNTCYWGGLGGSFCIMDVDARVCIAYAMNYHLPGLAGDPRNVQLMDAFRDVIKHI